MPLLNEDELEWLIQGPNVWLVWETRCQNKAAENPRYIQVLYKRDNGLSKAV